MSLFNYEQLFVKTEEITNAIKVNIVTYTCEKKIYKTSNNENLEYLNLNRPSSIVYLYNEKASIVLYVNLSKKEQEEDEFSDFVMTQGALALKSLLHLEEDLNFYVSDMSNIREFLGGMVLGYYKYNFLKKKKDNVSVAIISNYNNFVQIYNNQNFVRFLGDTPANLMTPKIFTEYAEKYCVGLDFEILEKDFMIKNGMNLLLGVSNGSNEDPKILRISYKCQNENKTKISLVGKGVTFDSGGISLKPSANMSAMKGDMLGAATTLAVIKMAHEFNLQVNIEAIIPLTENMPGGKATKPGDVHIGMSGVSVEVDNTDAEGRLILADGICLAQQSNPEYLFDIATLTGAISIALGEDFLGYFCNDDKLSELINKSSQESKDLAWRMPLSSLFLSTMKSNVAQIKNAGNRKGGSCTAAIFLKEFINKGVKWAHFDIAGVDFDHKNKSLYGNGMTGKGYPLLFEVIKNISENK